ncbi:Translation elongation factor P/YeiP, central [Dillenia turbinata]|uniref:Translation elongation factor P/YeiP, central n=1 Tax=Dillenia turbinata TaxID=194707 RepID=A0AAN8Z7Z7_9MAGN
MPVSRNHIQFTYGSPPKRIRHFILTDVKIKEVEGLICKPNGGLGVNMSGLELSSKEKVELRDVDSGNKVTERFRTDESIEKVFVEERSFEYLYTDGNTVVLMEPKTFEQIEVSKELFGKAAAYLKDNMTVHLQFYDEKPMSASVPKRVTCKAVEAQIPMKRITATPQYKRVLLDNGLTVLAPPFIVTGDEIVIDTTEDSYITR